MGILDTLLTPQNVERGVNLLKSNVGIVDALANNLTFLPSSGRLYAKNLAGSEQPVNEDFFSENQLAEIKRRTAEQMAKRSMKYRPDYVDENDPSRNLFYDTWHTRNKVVPYNLDSPLSVKGTFTDPKVDIDMTLGQSVYKENPDGTISIIDKHDFDAIAGGTGKGFYSKEGDPLWDPELKEDLVGPPDEREEWYLEPKYEFRDLEAFKPNEPGAEEYEPIEHWTPHMGWNTEYYVPKYAGSESTEEYMAKVFEAYKKGEISKSKLARVIGGTYGHVGNDPKWEYYKNMGMPIKKQSGIPININLGKISHLDKLKANPNFARYIAETETIPSKIRKEAQKIVPKRTAPIHSPHGGGPGTGGGYQPTSRAQNVARTSSRVGPGGKVKAYGLAHGGLIDIPLSGRSRYI